MTMNERESRSDMPLPLTEQAFHRLRQEVLTGALVAGKKLKVEELQRRYGFSSSPLREALSRLAQEGLVRADQRRGFRVAPISIDDLADITRLRVLIDPQALEDALLHGDDEWEARVVASFHRLEKIERRLPPGPLQLDADWSRLHREFHLTILSACTSERLRDWSASLFDQAERYRHVSAAFRTTPRYKSDDHRRLLEAVMQRDAETARNLWVEHVLHTDRNVREALRTRFEHLGVTDH